MCYFYTRCTLHIYIIQFIQCNLITEYCKMCAQRTILSVCRSCERYFSTSPVSQVCIFLTLVSFDKFLDLRFCRDNNNTSLSKPMVISYWYLNFADISVSYKQEPPVYHIWSFLVESVPEGSDSGEPGRNDRQAVGHRCGARAETDRTVKVGVFLVFRWFSCQRVTFVSKWIKSCQ